MSLGFKLSPAAWNSLSQKLIDDGLIEGDDGLVRNCNFFSALNVAIREKSSYKDKELRRNLRLGKNIHQHLRGEQSFKVCTLNCVNRRAIIIDLQGETALLFRVQCITRVIVFRIP